MADILLDMFCRVVLWGTAYGTARLLVPVLSLGWARVDWDKSGTDLTSTWPLWSKDPDGTINLGPRISMGAGILIWIAGFFAFALGLSLLP